MAARFSLKDHLFNPQTVGQLAGEYARALPRFDAEEFQRTALAGFPDRELMARLDWLADAVEAQLSPDFNVMADELEAAMPSRLDPGLTDDDFGQFIHAVPGILAVRHGLENHRARAMSLLYQATQRFSMEFYIRPFLNRWPEETLKDLRVWAEDGNYHVRRLVSEGTRPKLPWAKAVKLDPAQTLPLLDILHRDTTRYVTRSVANHLNDLSKVVPDTVLERLALWHVGGQQETDELDWITRHALRTLVKKGHGGALSMLGYRPERPVQASLEVLTPDVAIGDTLRFACRISAQEPLPFLVDYRIVFTRPDGREGARVFKLKKGIARPEKPLELVREHRFKANATTHKWRAGRHRLVLQVNGEDRAEQYFDLR